MIRQTLADEYTCISLSFEGVGDTMFESSASFCQRFLLHVSKFLDSRDKEFANQWLDEGVTDFDLLSFHLDKLCKDRKIVLLIDEVDQASNNRVFLHFIGMLRNKYLVREDEESNTFHSVILAGVHDMPWNIAVDFEVDMSFNPAEIATMLSQYEADHSTGMDIPAISSEIHSYTDGYPFLVSRICQCVDEKLGRDWTAEGVRSAVKILAAKKTTLSDDIVKNLESNRDLHDLMYSILIKGDAKKFVANDPVMDLGAMFGFIKSAGGKMAVSNRVFELVMADYFVSKESRSSSNKHVKGVLQDDIVNGGRFDMELCLRKFAEHYARIFSERDYEFLENHGRLLFLLYLTPLINGQGFYHIESQFTDLRRMDVVVDFGRDQFILELKLWRGESKHKEAYEQLLGYMGSKNASAGYLLTFDFRKPASKTPRAEWVGFGERQIFDVVV
ncbi:MAG: AAA family ATPase [Clostridiales bacterium]|nr:AAA family ATPase [Clostridiales bacterium]